jgi:hypothetical protein
LARVLKAQMMWVWKAAGMVGSTSPRAWARYSQHLHVGAQGTSNNVVVAHAAMTVEQLGAPPVAADVVVLLRSWLWLLPAPLSCLLLLLPV